MKKIKVYPVRIYNDEFNELPLRIRILLEEWDTDIWTWAAPADIRQTVIRAVRKAAKEYEKGLRDSFPEPNIKGLYGDEIFVPVPFKLKGGC